MRKVWAVIRREFLSRVRTRAFVIGTVLGPVMMGALFVLPILLSQRDTRVKRIAVLDAATGEFGERVAAELAEARKADRADGALLYGVETVDAAGRLETVRDSLVARVGTETDSALDGVVVVTDAALDSAALEYLGADAGSPADMGALQRTLRGAVRVERLARAGVSPDVFQHALAPVSVQIVQVKEGRATGESGESSFFLAYAMSLILYLALLLYGMQVMTSVVEEKANRIMEILVSSLTPFQLLLGKVVGVGLVGLFQLSIWGGTATALTSLRAPIARALGAAPDAVGAMSIPLIRLDLLAVFLLFFLVGFFLYAAAYAAVGAMCSALNEVQQAHTPITILVAGGLISMFALLSEPNGTLAKVLTLVPFLAPFVVPVRYSFSAISPAEVALSLAVMVAGLLAVVWVAARIYRVGVLMYGKRATLTEVWRWVRVGAS